MPGAAHADPLPVVDPGGDVELERRVLASVLPSPSQRSQGVSTMRPAPSQRGQVPERTICPSTVRDTCWTTPAPPHPGHVTEEVPAAAPVPLQASQLRATTTCTSSFVPVAASARSISTCAAMSGPRDGRGPAPPCDRRASHRRTRRRRPRGCRNRHPRARNHRLEPRVTKAVERTPALRVGEHLVRLGDGPEPELRVRLLAHVRVELARQVPEGALDLGAACVPRDAQQLVVVLLRRRHQGAP